MSETPNYLANALFAGGFSAAYDNKVKMILADKQFLARILKSTMSEFHDMEYDDIIPLIGTPDVASIPVATGLTNLPVEELPQQSNIPGEGLLLYDIRFYVFVPGSNGVSKVRIMVDIEAQNDQNPGYDLVTRGIGYGGRMISEQFGKIVTNSQYDKLEKVYSIWLCFNSPQKYANTISVYSIQQDNVYGECEKDERYDLMQVVMVRIPENGQMDKARNKPSPLHSLLYDTFQRVEPSDARLKRLRDEYGFTVTNELERGFSDMCNLSVAVEERGIKQGLEKGVLKRNSQLILNWHDRGMTNEEIANLLSLTEKDVLDVLTNEQHEMSDV